MTKLLPRAPLWDVLRGRAPVVGARCDPAARRGFVSPVELRVRMGISYGDPAAEEALALGRRSGAQDFAVLGRAALAALVTPGGAGRDEPRPFIVSAQVDALSAEEAVERILRPAPGGRIVHFVHPHALNLAAFDKALAARLARADLVLPDGAGLRMAAALLGLRLRDNLNGTDLLPLLCQGAARRGLPLALVGGRPEIAAACAGRLAAAAPGLQVALASDGFLDARACADVVARIKASAPVLVLVGMGTPLQEDWAWRHLAGTPGVCVLTVGGLFDFYSGRIPRAGAAWRELGLEWVYRLLQEPRRMAARYLLGNPLFLGLALLQKLRGRRLGQG